MQRLGELGRLVRSGRSAEQDRALAAAEAVANSEDARYVLAIYQLEIGRLRRDDALRVRGLDGLIAHRGTPSDRLPGYLGMRGDIAFRGGDLATASAAWTRRAELEPDDPQALANLAQVRQAQDDDIGAIALIRRAVALPAGGQGPDREVLYRQWLSIAYNAGLTEEGAAAAQALVAAYPSRDNWRLALVAYRQLASPTESAEIDLLRLMRAAGTFTAPAEYQRLAQLLMHAGRLEEGRAVLEDGLARGIVIMTTSPTPDILAEMDRRAADGAGAGASPPLPPGPAREVRMATDHALAGRRGAAEAGFRAVIGTAGPEAARWYADIARFWLSWLGRSG
jgi:hypothetical protein